MKRNDHQQRPSLAAGFKAVIAIGVLGSILVTAGELGHGPGARRVVAQAIEAYSATRGAPGPAAAPTGESAVLSHDGLTGSSPDLPVDSF